MEATTWGDDEVARWLARHAIAIRFDFEAGPSTENLNVKALPTTITFRGAQEIDRVVGIRSPVDLIRWLNGTLRGLTEIESLNATKETSVEARWEHLQALMGHDTRMSGEPFDSAIGQKALEESLWFWRNARATDLFDSRHLIPLSDSIKYVIRELILVHPPAKEAYEAELGRIEKRRDDPKELPNWLWLSHRLGKQEKILAWFDSIKESGQKRQLDQLRVLTDVLQEQDRWADLGSILVNPKDELERRWEDFQAAHTHADIPEEVRADVLRHRIAQFRELASTLGRALLAAGRKAEAEEVAARALELDGN
jgi:hypothetical protein